MAHWEASDMSTDVFPPGHWSFPGAQDTRAFGTPDRVPNLIRIEPGIR